MKGLTAFIYSKDGNVKLKSVTIVMIDNNPVPNDCQIFEPSESSPAAKVVHRFIRGDYVHIELVEPCPAGLIGYMYDGRLLYSSDSRWNKLVGHSYPVCFHDRTETQEVYDMLSR